VIQVRVGIIVQLTDWKCPRLATNRLLARCTVQDWLNASKVSLVRLAAQDDLTEAKALAARVYAGPRVMGWGGVA
jgi:hypothetical protein